MAVTAQDNRELGEDDLSYIQGVLRIEIKDASKIYDNEYQQGRQRLCVAVSVQGLTKRTRPVLHESGEAVWGQTKLFPVIVPLAKRHADNNLHVAVLGNDNNPDSMSQDRVIGVVMFHVHDVVRQSPVTGTFDLFNGAYQTTGEIRLSLSFSYGLFGYGYSPQLKEDNHQVDHYLKYSLFPRIDPVVGRLDPNKHILVPKATRHPLFIPFNQRVHLSFGQEIAPTLDNIHDTSGKFSLLGQNMGHFHALQDQLKKESSRADRLAFLSGLVLDSNKKVEAIKEGIEVDDTKRDTSLNNGFLALSADEMKERGFFVGSLQKEEKEKIPESSDPSNAPGGPSSDPNGASTSSSSTPSLPTHSSSVSLPSSSSSTRVRSSTLTSSSPSASPSSSLSSNLGAVSRGRAPTLRPSLPIDPSVVSLSPLHSHSPHSMGTPLLSHNSPATSSIKSSEGSPANPHIQRLKNL